MMLGGVRSSGEASVAHSAREPCYILATLIKNPSVTTTEMRWKIINYLCMLLDLDTKQE
jgi:hypothetical protein